MEILLVIVLIVSTLFLTIIGVQLFVTLREFQKTLQQSQKIIKAYETLGTDLDKTKAELTGFANGFKVVLKAIQLMSHQNEKK